MKIRLAFFILLLCSIKAFPANITTSKTYTTISEQIIIPAFFLSTLSTIKIKEIEKRKLQAEAAGNTALAASLQTQIDEKNSSIATNETKIKELQGDPSAATPVKGLIESKSELLKKAAESIQNELGAIDEIQESSSRTISQVGGTQRLLELTNSRMENFKTFSEEFLATETDADPAKVYTDMAMQKSVMDAALKALAQIVPKTILDFM